MIYLGTILCIVLAASLIHGHRNEPFSEKMDKEVKECKARLDLSDGQFTEMMESEDMKELGCFHACLLRELGVLVDDELDKKAIESTVRKMETEKEEEEVSKMIEAAFSCADEASANKADDICTKSGKYMECIYKSVAVDEEK